MRSVIAAILVLATCAKPPAGWSTPDAAPATKAVAPAPADAERAWKEALQRGRELEKSGDHAAAVKAFQAALAARPDEPEALSELGWAAFQAKDLATSKAASQKAADRATTPNQKAASLYNLGRALEEEGDKPGALAAYDESLRLRPNKTVEARRAALAGGGDEAGFREGVEALAKARKMTVVSWGSAPLDEGGRSVLFATLEPSGDGEFGLYALRTADGQWWDLGFQYDGKTQPWVGGRRAAPPVFAAVADTAIAHSQSYSGGYTAHKVAYRGGAWVVLSTELLADVRESDKPETTDYAKNGVCVKPCPRASAQDGFGPVSGPMTGAKELE